MYCFLHAVYLCCASCILVFLCAVYLCCMLCIGFAHHVFLAVHSVFHLQRMFCAEYHKHLETTHFRYESPIMGKSKIFSKWPPPFSAPKSQLELLLHDIVYLREPLVCSLTYFILCTQRTDGRATATAIKIKKRTDWTKIKIEEVVLGSNKWKRDPTIDGEPSWSRACCQDSLQSADTNL